LRSDERGGKPPHSEMGSAPLNREHKKNREAGSPPGFRAI